MFSCANILKFSDIFDENGAKIWKICKKNKKKLSFLYDISKIGLYLQRQINTIFRMAMNRAYWWWRKLMT